MTDNEPMQFLKVGFTVDDKNFPLFSLYPVNHLDINLVSDIAVTMAHFVSKVNSSDNFETIYEDLEDDLLKMVQNKVNSEVEAPKRVSVYKLGEIIKSSDKPIKNYFHSHF